jgi:hypothetical protein
MATPEDLSKERLETIVNTIIDIIVDYNDYSKHQIDKIERLLAYYDLIEEE